MVDRDLLQRCGRREPGAFEELVELTGRQVYTLAHRLVGDRHEAEDVAQEAYLRVYRSLRSFRGDSRFETWLHRVVANVAINHMRSRARFGELMDEPDTIVRIEGAPSTEDVPEREELADALAQLPVAQRVAVVLKDVYGFSTAEIAERLDTTDGAVKLRLHRGRRNLKNLIHGARESEHAEMSDRIPEYAEGQSG
ncbi:MAG: RNA polymerase sigma factor [Actinomycetota bacterium]